MLTDRNFLMGVVAGVLITFAYHKLTAKGLGGSKGP